MPSGTVLGRIFTRALSSPIFSENSLKSGRGIEGEADWKQWVLCGTERKLKIYLAVISGPRPKAQHCYIRVNDDRLGIISLSRSKNSIMLVKTFITASVWAVVIFLVYPVRNTQMSYVGPQIDIRLAVPRWLGGCWHDRHSYNRDRLEQPYIHIIYCITTVHPKILMEVYTYTYIHTVSTVYIG